MSTSKGKVAGLSAVYAQNATAPSAYDSNDDNIVADNGFFVVKSAIPEFSTINGWNRSSRTMLWYILLDEEKSIKGPDDYRLESSGYRL